MGEKTAEQRFNLGIDAWLDNPEESVINLENALQLGLSDISNKATAHAILGNIYHQKFDRNSDAIVEYEKALEIDEQSEEELLGKDLRDMIVPELADCYGNEAGELLRNENQIDKAIELCQKGMLLAETSDVCKVILGESYWAQENWLNAIETYNKVDIESLEPSLIITICGQLIDAHINTDDFEGIAKNCKMSLVTDNKSEHNLLSDSNRKSLTNLLVKSDYNIALKLLQEEEYDSAITILDELLEYDPKHIDGLCRKGDYFIIKKNVDSALECFEKCLQIDADCCDALVGKGMVFYNYNKLDKAIEYFDKALDIDPTHEKANELKKLMQNAINKKSENGPFEEIIEKGRNLAINEDFTEAIEYFNKVLELNPNNEDCLFYKGVSLYHLEKYNESGKHFDTVLKMNPEHSRAWNYKGRCNVILENYDDAIDCLNKADELNPKDIETLRLKGLAFSFLNEEKEAILCLDEALEIDPENEIVLGTMGTVLYESGKYEDALRYCDKALAINPKNEQIIKDRRHIADAMYNAKNVRDVNDVEFEYIEKAYEFARLKEHEKAIKCLDEAIALNANILKAWVLKAHILGGHFEEHEKAIWCWDKAISLNPDNAESWYYKGLALSIMLKHSAAIECYDKVIEIDPEYEDVQQQRADKLRVIEGEKAIQSESTENGLYWYTLAENRLEEDKKDIDTLNAFENALKFGELTPFEEARSNALLAMMYGGRDRKNEMNVCLKRALQLNDANEDILRKKDKKLYAGVCKQSAWEEKNTDEVIRLLETPIELGFEDLYSFFDYNYLAIHYNKSADESADFDTKIYKLEKSIDYLEKAEETAPYPEWARQSRSTINERQNKINGLRHPELEIRNNPEKIKEIKTKISKIESEVNRLEENHTKKFNEAGEIAYSAYKEKSVELTTDSKIKIEEILSIDKLIEKVKQEKDDIKGRQKKSGFWGKLGDAVSSTTKLGKLKLDLYNLEKKKNNAFTDFGEVLWISSKNGQNEMEILAETWKDITEIEKQINKNEEEINNLNKILG